MNHLLVKHIMNVYIMNRLFLFLNAFLIHSLATALNIEHESNYHKSESQELLEESLPQNSENLTTILELIEDEQFEAPVIRPPSKCMVFIRSYGLRFIYKCIALKNWIKRQFYGDAEKKEMDTTEA